METTRRYVRASVNFDVDVLSYSAGATNRDQGRLVVLGAGGAFLELGGTYAVGSMLKLGFKLPSTAEAVSCLAIVRDSQQGRGAGVEFVDLEPRDRARVTAFVTRLGSDPETRAAN